MKFNMILALLLAPMPALVAGCGVQDFAVQRQALSQAQFSFERVALRNADIPLLKQDAGVDMDVVLQVKNPNDATATLDKLDYEIAMDGATIATGTLSKDFSVPPGATDLLEFPLHVPYQGLPSLAVQALKNREATFTIKGVSHMDTPFGRMDVPLELEHKQSL